MHWLNRQEDGCMEVAGEGWEEVTACRWAPYPPTACSPSHWLEVMGQLSTALTQLRLAQGLRAEQVSRAARTRPPRELLPPSGPGPL